VGRISIDDQYPVHRALSSDAHGIESNDPPMEMPWDPFWKDKRSR
jgi:hypothetical protein